MLVAVISDIHSNLEALTVVLEDLDRLAVEHVWSLGDMVGYGPDPEAVVELARARGIESVMGNHEKGLADPGFLDWFNPQARAALTRNAELISPATRQYLTTLPRFLVRQGLRLVHGCPPQSVGTYLFEYSTSQLGRIMAKLEESICLVGHTHELDLYERLDGRTHHPGLKEGRRHLDPAARYLINAGSVGQPRDGDPRAKYVLLDLEALTLEVRCLDYPYRETAAKIRALGLPEIFARRLGP